MFENFQRFDVDCGETTIHGVVGGSGPPLLLLHGYPQTHAMWHRVAPMLATHYRVVAADLRGYGRSGKPDGGEQHIAYSKRAMAADMVSLMRQHGHDQFFIGAHDRGARVAHRLALDWPDTVNRMVLLDIAPTREMYALADSGFAHAYWHWYFLVQPSPLPENLIGADPDFFWRTKCGSGSAGLTPFSQEAMSDYLTCFRDPATIHASCEDYRAAAGIDIEHDNQDGDRKVTCPLHVVWARQGVIERCFDPLALWRQRADDVSGGAMEGGHYLAEESPEQVFTTFHDFFSRR